METILEPLIQSPALLRHLEQLQELVLEEQERRELFYQTITDAEKAEFINGKVIMHSPVKKQHNLCSGFLYQLLNIYTLRHKTGGFVGFEKIFVSLTRNDYEPDICYFAPEKAQHFTAHQMKFPAPDFIAEILSPSTETIDRGVKFEDYAAHGVAEYWIINPESKTVEQYVEQNGIYNLLATLHEGVIRSSAIVGFEIPLLALFDEYEHLLALQAILQSTSYP